MSSSTDKVLVYHHRGAPSPVVPGGLAVVTTAELESVIAANPNLQSTTKPLPHNIMNLEIYERDLLTPAQQTEFAGMPNQEQNVAGIKVPYKVLFGNFIGIGKHDELVILSRKR